MGQASGASYNKAFFTNVDTNAVFYVQFNPKEFKLDEKANWKASEEQENTRPLLTYEKGEPTTVGMDLIFDSTDTGDNVYDTFVMPLRDFLTSDVSQVSEGDNSTTSRPPYCKFTWGTFSFDCVIEKVSCTFLMFKPDGTPLRAKVQVGLKERNREVPGGSRDQVMLTALGSMFEGAGTNATTYTSLPGDTTTSIAQRFDADPSDIALANNIADPLEIPPGTRLVIPANGELAQVLAKQSLQHTPADWRDGRKLDPFDVPQAKGGDTQYVPSALDEDGPIALEYDVDPGSLANATTSFGAEYKKYEGETVLGSSGQGLEYGEYGDGEFTFGRTEAQSYGDYGPSDATAQQGDGAELGFGGGGGGGGDQGGGGGQGGAGQGGAGQGGAGQGGAGQGGGGGSQGGPASAGGAGGSAAGTPSVQGAGTAAVSAGGGGSGARAVGESVANPATPTSQGAGGAKAVSGAEAAPKVGAGGMSVADALRKGQETADKAKDEDKKS